MKKEELLSKTRQELVDLGILNDVRLGAKWSKGKMIAALSDNEATNKVIKKDDDVSELKRLLKEAQNENRMLSLEKRVYDATKGERVIRDFGEIRESTKVKLGEEMVVFTPQIDPTSKKKTPYNILVMINGVGFGTNKGEKFNVPKRLVHEVYRLICDGYGPGAVTIPNPNLD